MNQLVESEVKSLLYELDSELPILNQMYDFVDKQNSKSEFCFAEDIGLIMKKKLRLKANRVLYQKLLSECQSLNLIK